MDARQLLSLFQEVYMNSVLEVRKRMKNTLLADDEVLYSRTMANYLRFILEAPSRKLPPEKQFFSVSLANNKSDADFTAFTNGTVITINVGHPFVASQDTREEKLVMMKGLDVHEWGHIRFSNFTLLRESKRSLTRRNEIFPALTVNDDSPEWLIVAADGIKALEEFLNEKESAAYYLEPYYQEILNIIEDGYIEEACHRILGGALVDALAVKRAYEWKETAPLSKYLDLQKDEVLTRWQVVRDMLLVYSKWGKFKYDEADEHEKEFLQLYLNPVLEAVNTAVYMDDSVERGKLCNAVVGLLWGPVLKEELLSAMSQGERTSESGVKGRITTAKAPNASGSGRELSLSEARRMGSSMSARKKTMSILSSPSGESKDTETSSGKTGSKTEECDSGKADDHIASGDAPSVIEPTKEGTDDTDGGVPPSEPSEGKSEDADDLDDEGAEDTIESEVESSEVAPHEETSDDTNGDVPATESAEDKSEDADDLGDEGTEDSVESDAAPSGGLMDDEDSDSEDEEADYTPDWERLRRELSREFLKVAHDETLAKIKSDLNDELTEDLTTFMNDLDYGAAHKHSKKILQRIASVPMEVKETSRQLIHDTGMTAALMARKLEPYMKQAKEDKVAMSGFYSGSRFDATRLFTGDWRYFKRDECPFDGGGIAVTLLVDESGSMTLSDDRRWSRATIARRTALVLYQFCARLGIPCSVIGHTSPDYDGTALLLDIFADFDSPDEDDIYRICGIQAKSENRDGAALLFAGKRLLERKEKTKLLISISDGAPMAPDYYGRAAENDVISVVQGLRNEGLIIFAAAIGSDRAKIERLYQEGFLDISNQDTLPTQMLQLVRRFIR